MMQNGIAQKTNHAKLTAPNKIADRMVHKVELLYAKRDDLLASR